MNAKILIVVFLVGLLVCSARARSLEMEKKEAGAGVHTTFFHHRFPGAIGFGGGFGRIPGFGVGVGGGGSVGTGMGGGGFGGGPGSAFGAGTGGRAGPGAAVGDVGNSEGFGEGTAMTPMNGKGVNGAKAGGGLEDGSH